MRIREFKLLPIENQYTVLWEEGVLIDACIEGETKKLLYALHDFYVELWCHTHTNKHIWILSFKQGVLLEKYLDKYPRLKIA